MSRLVDRVALITGGSRGFGSATALCFAGEGADVVIAYRAAEAEAAAVVAQIERAGRRAYLASDDGRFMTGQCLDVNGGSLMV